MNSLELSNIDFVEDSLLGTPNNSPAPEWSQVNVAANETMPPKNNTADIIDLTEEPDSDVIDLTTPEPTPDEVIDEAIGRALEAGQITQSDAADIDLFLHQPDHSPVRASERWGNANARLQNGAKKLVYLLYLNIYNV